MGNNTNRLYFIDCLRAFAILMMLQGHFISGVLDTNNINTQAPIYQIWLYFRGFTAPLFFTITGWIFTFLLIKKNDKKWQNARILKGIKRASLIIFIGYLLRINLKSFYYGHINSSFIYTDVLHIIGLGLLCLILIFVLCFRNNIAFSITLFLIGVLVFFTQPLYSSIKFQQLSPFLATYLTKANGGVFYLFPWLGYICFGGFIAIILKYCKYSQKTLNKISILFFFIGVYLVFYSSNTILFVEKLFLYKSTLLSKVAYNNFLFIRLGDVLILFSIFIIIQTKLKNKFWRTIGENTLPLYVIHYFILYGSLTGVGIYKYYHHSFSWAQTIIGAFSFIIVCVLILYLYKIGKQKTRNFFMRLIKNIINFKIKV